MMKPVDIKPIMEKVFGEKKVYCMDCKWYWFLRSEGPPGDCRHPQNRTDSYEAPNDTFKEEPAILNGKNNCKWYEPKRKEPKEQC